jgi:hypothetical protein
LHLALSPGKLASHTNTTRQPLSASSGSVPSQLPTLLYGYAWIKAHAGNYGHELPDKLAKEGTRNSDIYYDKFPKSEIERKERNKSIEKWQKKWENSTKGS